MELYFDTILSLEELKKFLSSCLDVSRKKVIIYPLAEFNDLSVDIPDEIECLCVFENQINELFQQQIQLYRLKFDTERLIEKLGALAVEYNINIYIPNESDPTDETMIEYSKVGELKEVKMPKY